MENHNIIDYLILVSYFLECFKFGPLSSKFRMYHSLLSLFNSLRSCTSLRLLQLNLEIEVTIFKWICQRCLKRELISCLYQNRSTSLVEKKKSTWSYGSTFSSV